MGVAIDKEVVPVNINTKWEWQFSTIDKEVVPVNIILNGSGY